MSSEHVEPVSTDPNESAKDGWTVNYITGDLFTSPPDEALAHCISEDLSMGKGIAVMFKQKFKGVAELKEQKKQPGECAVLRRDRRFVYYLITKKRAFHKPTYDSLRHSLEDMKLHCVRNGISRISMPRIGCGLDQLKWERVSEILGDIFKHTDISITVYSLPR
ncbi:ADP-ribose glycohydrolase OARD1 [Aulostomus maculatus]